MTEIEKVQKKLDWYGFTDVVEPIDVKNTDGEVIGSIEASLICYELEDGTECNEDGTEL
jgi:hypothetical protein